jgi:hypothetical protein
VNSHYWLYTVAFMGQVNTKFIAANLLVSLQIRITSHHLLLQCKDVHYLMKVYSKVKGKKGKVVPALN